MRSGFLGRKKRFRSGLVGGKRRFRRGFLEEKEKDGLKLTKTHLGHAINPAQTHFITGQTGLQCLTWNLFTATFVVTWPWTDESDDQPSQQPPTDSA